MTYDLLIYPNLSRVSAIDWLASQINAREKIASETDLSCISEKRARETDLFYTRLMPIDPQIPKFEFFRYQDFFSNWLGVKNVSRPTINRGHLPPVEARNSPYAMIFPGAGRQFRRYPADRLGSVANHIISTSDLDVIVAGSEEDAPLARMILSLVENKKRLHSICGKCNLAQTMAYASRSSMIVCHDSFSLHLAASLNIPFVCISDASDFGRYHPYPAEYGLTARFLYPPSAARMIGSEPDYARKICNQARQHKIVDIDVRDVLAAVDEVMAGVHRNGRSQSS